MHHFRVCNITGQVGETYNDPSVDGSVYSSINALVQQRIPPYWQCAQEFANFKCSVGYPTCEGSQLKPVCKASCLNLVNICDGSINPTTYNIPTSAKDCDKYDDGPDCTYYQGSDISAWFTAVDGGYAFIFPPPPGGVANGTVLGVFLIVIIMLAVLGLGFLMKKQQSR
eukprot:TRINITY_DN7634_c0_g2_i3.p1 TRINITY_DN7634_c0_g2~~TRINITY_DN7634_c0_g2_i3.p1  ORF type:complete len:169 (-),score=23.70 TRINITY_DN7634_c0_g2_i3:16-522(-)